MSYVVYNQRQQRVDKLIGDAIDDIPPPEQVRRPLPRSVILGSALGLSATPGGTGGSGPLSKDDLLALLRTLTVEEWQSIPNLRTAVNEGG